MAEDKPHQEPYELTAWRTKPNPYHITYPNETTTKFVLEKLIKLPALVAQTSITNLKTTLKQVALGKAFIIQGGDCAELFEYCQDDLIHSRIKLLQQLGLIFGHMMKVPTVLIARIAGQYGKPRNGMSEVVDGVEVPKFHGDNINGYEVRDREPDPQRMLSAYLYASSTMNSIRNLLSFEGGIGHSGFDWGRLVLDNKEMNEVYVNTVAKLLAENSDPIGTTPFVFTSHEGLFLHYEEALTKPWRLENTRDPNEPTKWFNSSAHFVWIGDKTRQLDGAHVEYFRGLENPIGIKIGPSIKIDEILPLLEILNPEKEIGKVTLITRLGEDKVPEILGELIETVKGSGHTVVWQCDPLHGNTRNTSDGIRTRSFESILNEVIMTMDIHQEHGSHLGGIHLEMTPDDVVECVGGSEGWTDSQLGGKYLTRCDPRLNGMQALELGFRVALHYRARKSGDV